MENNKNTQYELNKGLAQMLKGGVIMDVTTPEQARIAEAAGACAVMALERIPADIRAAGGVSRMSDPKMIKGIQEAVSIPVMAKCRIGHFVEAQILEAIEIDYIDESEVLSPADDVYHINKRDFKVPFVCGARDLGEALRRINEGASMIRTKGEPGTGDIVQAGIMISNSETGLGAVNIQPLIYRLVCSNGMVVNEAGTRRAHIGRVNTTDVNFALYSQQTLDAEDRAFVLKIQDTVRAAVDEARFSTVLERMRESKQAQLNTQDLPGLVKLAGSSFGILEEEGKGILQHLIEDGDFTLYGLANAVTRFSQDVESYDRATKLEEIGYSVMTMSPLLLQKINQTQVTKLAA